MKVNKTKLQEKSRKLRVAAIEMLYKAQSGHPGSTLSTMDILTVLFYGGVLKHHPKDPESSKRDYFILSNGHACPALYAVLADRGYFPKSELDMAIEKETPETLASKLLQGRETENKSIYALFDYRDEVIRHMVWALKYRRNRRVAQTFAVLLYDFLIEEFSDLSVYSDFYKPILVPIPLYKKRFRERGFNQSELLAKELVKIDNFCVLDTNILQKIKNTPHQTNLHRHKRLKNVIDSFGVKNPDTIKNRNLVVLDDVTTTGATLNEAKKILLKAGAKKVVCVAIGH